jgi:hypothetical protein
VSLQLTRAQAAQLVRGTSPNPEYMQLSNIDLSPEVLYSRAKTSGYLSAFHTAKTPTEREFALERCISLSRVFRQLAIPLCQDREIKAELERLATLLQRTALPNGLRDENNFPENDRWQLICDKLDEVLMAVRSPRRAKPVIVAPEWETPLTPWIHGRAA